MCANRVYGPCVTLTRSLCIFEIVVEKFVKLSCYCGPDGLGQSVWLVITNSAHRAQVLQ